ncbi:MAG: PRC-barrel domain-containing protein [Candidatus Bathyarchaeota archaeon]
MEAPSKKFVSKDKVIGKQVIDNRGVVVGTVKDLAVSVGENVVEAAITVTLRGGEETTVPWLNVKAAEDVVLLDKEVEVSRTVPMPPTVTHQISTIGTLKNCSHCGATLIPRAKFCPKCGKSTR